MTRALAAPCWVVNCDFCHEALGDGNGVEMHFETERDAVSTATETEWEVTEDGRFTCYSCIENRDSDGDS